MDMLLTEQGGVYAMIGTTCCTFIPNNTAPDGLVARALAWLQSLRFELAENSGINDPFTGWMENMFGRWKGMIHCLQVSCCWHDDDWTPEGGSHDVKVTSLWAEPLTSRDEPWVHELQVPMATEETMAAITTMSNTTHMQQHTNTQRSPEPPKSMLAYQ